MMNPRMVGVCGGSWEPLVTAMRIASAEVTAFELRRTLKVMERLAAGCGHRHSRGDMMTNLVPEQDLGT